MAGVSRTTLSNVINGNTKRVSQAHGMYSLQDSFVGELVGTIQMEAEMKGYYVMLIGGKNIQNVGVDDYSGGYQIGSYLCSCGFDKALFLAETDIDSDYSRWMGFKQAMEKEGKFCSRTRLIVIPGERNRRIQKYKELLPRFLQVKAVAFSSDYAAIEAMNFLSDHGIKVPEQVSVTGFDDSIYARMVRPRLTTVHQDVGQKAHLAFSRLLRMVAGEQLKEFNIKSPVYLVKRDSVKI